MHSFGAIPVFISGFTFQNEDILVMAGRPAKYGPQVIVAPKEFIIRSRGGVEVDAKDTEASQIICAIICTYYLLDLTYPKKFSAVLGTLQEFVVRKPFFEKKTKFGRFLKTLRE